MAGNTRNPGQSVSARLLAVLAAFEGDRTALTLTDIAAAAGLAPATAHRLVGELVDWGALVRTETGEYVVGQRLWKLGMRAPVQADLREIASPFLHDIYGATLATVHLAVRDGDQVLYLDRLAGHASVPAVSRIGARLPLHATGVGKVLLAYAPKDVHDRVLSDLPRLTRYTVVHPGKLEAELRRVHREGFAQTVEEMALGACSVAVPVRGADDDVVAALGIVVPNFNRDRSKLVASLQVAAQGISRSFH
ncbi:IclR family transcriptional regulator [Rhodococcus sp. RS1C4]|uniref:IclR family transcriptional regulator n=1 Tax=Rhodococcus sp. 14-2470-1a TaxID=2023150 RepID=UPI000B9A451F|nr:MULTISPECIES: IclR family transcriptional regulator [unclassified Rhodococcus (in: high G+C Gram-positive bacteria)]OZC58779.1 IclR family transcriptional regulator [Rhodococcus sp. RS1C4]OZF57089.1 IclR family transcriptional regulator [Rhodococcus sp. 14-2470-1a]